MTSAANSPEEAAALAAEIKEKFPEAWEFILELYNCEGPDGDPPRLIEGTRNITYFGPPRDLSGPNVVSTAEMYLDRKDEEPKFPIDRNWA